MSGNEVSLSVEERNLLALKLRASRWEHALRLETISEYLGEEATAQTGGISGYATLSRRHEEGTKHLLAENPVSDLSVACQFRHEMERTYGEGRTLKVFPEWKRPPPPEISDAELAKRLASVPPRAFLWAARFLTGMPAVEIGDIAGSGSSIVLSWEKGASPASEAVKEKVLDSRQMSAFLDVPARRREMLAFSESFWGAEERMRREDTERVKLHISALRRKTRTSRTELADHLRVTTACMSGWCSGKFAPSYAKRLAVFAMSELAEITDDDIERERTGDSAFRLRGKTAGVWGSLALALRQSGMPRGEAAEFLGVSVAVLKSWVSKTASPHWTKLGEVFRFISSYSIEDSDITAEIAADLVYRFGGDVVRRLAGEAESCRDQKWFLPKPRP